MTNEDLVRYNHLDLMIWKSLAIPGSAYLRKSWFKEMMDIKDSYPNPWDSNKESFDDESPQSAQRA